MLKKDAKVLASPPPPPINKAQQECDAAFYGMLRGAGNPIIPTDAKPDMQIGAISPRVSTESLLSARSMGDESVRSSRDSSSRPGSSRRRKKQQAQPQNSNRDSQEEIALPRKGKLSEDEMDRLIEEDRMKYEEMQKERMKVMKQGKEKKKRGTAAKKVRSDEERRTAGAKRQQKHYTAFLHNC